MVLVLVVVVLALGLSVHVVAMGIHGMAMMLGFCVAVLAGASALLLPSRRMLAVALVAPLHATEGPKHQRVEPIGRHPPDQGIRLRD